MTGAITRCRILTPDETFDSGTVVFDERGRITAAGQEVEPPPRAEIADGRGLTIVPGFIDLHVHGGGGFSLATRDPEEICRYARWVTSHGVTSFMPTICAGSVAEALGFLRTAARAKGEVDGGANVLGVYLEGPFVNLERRGALPAGWITPPDLLIFERLFEAAEGHLKVLTLAPELPGAMDILEDAVARGIVVAIGHTDADFDTAFEAFEAGASHLTHAFNGMRPFHHREPGPVFAALGRDDVSIELIADGVHLHPATVRALTLVAGSDRATLVSDGVPPAGHEAGRFVLGQKEAVLARGKVALPDGTIAGSAATLDQIVANVARPGVANLANSVRMASTVPARVLGLSERKGRIAPGYDADLVALDAEFNVAMTWVRGRVVYSR